MNNKVLFVWPSVDFSIMDVANGIHDAFIAQGLDLVDYRLNNRMKFLSVGFSAFKPVDQDLNMENIALHASEGLPYYAILNRTKWIFIVSGMGLHPNAIVAAKNLGCKIAIWFTESPYNKEFELELAKLADVAFVNEKSVVSDFQQVVEKTYYIPHAYRAEFHKPNQNTNKPIDLFFLGTGFAERQALFEGMDFEGINFEFGGLFNGLSEPNHLMKYFKYGCLNNQEVIDLYYQTKILFNPHRWAEGAYSANPRIYEGAACKIFQISDYRPEIQELFGDSIPTYEHGVSWEASALIRRYLTQPEVRDNMANEAYKKVEPHTFDNRAKFIIKELSLNV